MKSELVTAGATYMLAKLTGKPLEQLGELLADRVRLWQWKNQIHILSEAKKYAEEHGIPIRPIHLKALVPLLDGAALEEEPTLQQLWARLIANSGACQASVTITAFAAEFLRGISTVEAHVLNVLVEFADTADVTTLAMTTWAIQGLPTDTKGRVPFEAKSMLSKAQMDEDKFYLAVDNLVRFNVITSPFTQDLDGRHIQGFYCFTRLGWEVMKLIRAKPVPHK